MRDFNENARNGNVARAAYDLELELIERDLGFDLDEVIHLLETEGEAVGDRAASRFRHAWCEFDWRRRHAHHILQWAAGRQ